MILAVGVVDSRMLGVLIIIIVVAVGGRMRIHVREGIMSPHIILVKKRLLVDHDIKKICVMVHIIFAILIGDPNTDARRGQYSDFFILYKKHWSTKRDFVGHCGFQSEDVARLIFHYFLRHQ